ncbi:MAG: DUF2871 domain-containing protein [Lachnospiraceae bacterium]
MKKLINNAFIYAIAAIICGVFYREFTKWMSFTGRTTLAFTHLHLFALGTGVFLILALFSLQTNLLEQRKFRISVILYNIGLPLTVIMLFVRGIFQVWGTPLSKGMDAAISGMAGISHIFLTIAIVFLFLCLRNCSKKN